MHYKCNKCPESISHLITFRSRSYWEPLHKWTKNILPFHIIHLPVVNFVVYTFPRFCFPLYQIWTRNWTKASWLDLLFGKPTKQQNKGYWWFAILESNPKRKLVNFCGRDKSCSTKLHDSNFVLSWKHRNMMNPGFCLKTDHFLNRNIVIHCHTMPIVHIAIVSQ